MTQLTQGSDMELRELIESFFSTSMRASSPRKIDMMVDALREHEQRSIDRAVALTESDLAWCIGKLRGLGHPAEHLEAKYGLSPTTTEEKENA